MLKQTLHKIYVFYIGLIPVIANLYIIKNLESNTVLAFYFLIGLLVAIMYFAVKVETLRFPDNIKDIIILMITPLIPLLSLLVNNDFDILRYFGIVTFYEFVSLLFSLIIIGLISGGIGNMETIPKDIWDTIKSPKTIKNNLRGIFPIIIVISILFIFILYIYQDLFLEVTLFSLLFQIIIPLILNSYENMRGIYSTFRSKFNYAAIVIIISFLWFFTYSYAAYNFSE